jgi:DNA-directed RNA polymerase subunit H (RpoH/RPB5)
MNVDILKSMLASRGVNVSAPETIEPGLIKYDSIVVSTKDPRVSEKNVREFAKKVLEYGATTGIIVISSPPSETILNIVASLSNVIQIFHEAQLTFDILKHRKVPAHRILSKEETDKMFEKFHISISEITKKVQEDKVSLDPELAFLQQLGMKHKEYMPLPYIWTQDPVAKWIGAKPGDIIEVMRKSKTSGSTPYYRFCVANVV